mgnify:FL=1
MTDDQSSLSSDNKTCPKCGANWIGGQHYWYTGKKGNELDLAGLVCNSHGDETCINPSMGFEGGVTWEERMKTLVKLEDESSNG